MLNVHEIFYLQLILADQEEINSENKDFIEDLKEISSQGGGCFIVFDQKDITLKINIDKIEMKKPELEFYSKVDVKINDKIESEDIICMLEYIPNHMTVTLEWDYIEQIIELMKRNFLIEDLNERRTKFVYKGIEIKPKIIKSKMDEDYLKNEIKEKEAKRVRLNMDCDK